MELESIVGKEQSEAIDKMSPGSKLKALREISEQMPNGADLSVLQRHIVNLMSEQRSSLEFAVPTFAPNMYDVLVTDIKPSDLTKIGEELGSIALSETEDIPNFPVQGILFGPGQRVFIPLIVKKRTKSIKVNFLFDTGSPSTYLRQETLRVLGFQDSTPTETNVIIHGTVLTVYLSSNHFENVDLLGQDYLSAIRGFVNIDYPLKTIAVNMKS
jgi:hypothetical protein